MVKIIKSKRNKLKIESPVRQPARQTVGDELNQRINEIEREGFNETPNFWKSNIKRGTEDLNLAADSNELTISLGTRSF